MTTNAASHDHRARPRVALLAVVTGMLVVAGLLAAGPTSAQQGGPPSSRPCNAPYGCPPTSPPGGGGPPSCSMAPDRGSPGTRVTATVTGVVPANGNVTITFDGAPVGSGTASGGTAVIEFTVPADASNGSHPVVAVAPNGSDNCGNGNAGFTVVGGDDAQVLGGGTARGGASGGSGSSDGGRGNLALTGFTIVGFLAAAAMLFLAGKALLEQSRRRART